MSNAFLNQHCINCELFMTESQMHLTIGIDEENFGSTGLNVTVLDAISFIYGISARDLAIAYLNLNSENEKNKMEKDLSEMTVHILQQGLHLCCKCVSIFKQVVVNHLKFKNKSTEWSLLYKALKKNRPLEIKTEIDFEEEISGSDYENVESWENTVKSCKGRDTAGLHNDSVYKETELEFPNQCLSQDIEPAYQFRDFDSQSYSEDIKMDPLHCVQNENCFTPNIEMAPCSIVLHRIKSESVPFCRKESRPRKKSKTISITKNRKERLSNRKSPTTRTKPHFSSGIGAQNVETSISSRDPNGSATESTDGDKSYHCQLCDTYFKRFGNFKAHQQRQHNKTEEMDNYFKCGCGNSYCKIESLCAHHNQCKFRAPVMCDVCGELFNKSYKLYTHKKSEHSENHPLFPKCDLCDTVFVFSQTLNDHISAVHSTDAPAFICYKCGNSFKVERNLRRHEIYAHEQGTVDTELLRCKECGILMKHKLGLKKHMRTMHNVNQKIITCPQCGKITKNMTNMRIHMKVHDPNRILKSNKPPVLQNVV